MMNSESIMEICFSPSVLTLYKTSLAATMVRWFEGGVNQVKDKLEKFTKNCTKTLLQ
jgi:hypothetical protein